MGEGTVPILIVGGALIFIGVVLLAERVSQTAKRRSDPVKQKPKTEMRPMPPPSATMIQTPKSCPPAPQVAEQGCIPPGPTAQGSSAYEAPQSEGPPITVAAGDTLAGIARKNGISVVALKEANGLKDGLLRVGQTLKVPVAPSGPAPVRELVPAIEAAALLSAASTSVWSESVRANQLSMPVMVQAPNAKSFKVVVDDNSHYMDDDERCEFREFDTCEEAIAACKRLVDAELASMIETSKSADDLFDRYTSFGQDPFIVSIGSATGKAAFSASGYAKQRIAKMWETREASFVAAPFEEGI